MSSNFRRSFIVQTGYTVRRHKIQTNRYLLILLSVYLILCFIMLIWLNEHHNSSHFYEYLSEKQLSNYKSTKKADLITQKLRFNSTKYLLTDVGEDTCGGVGNVIFRIASLYGIGKELGRNPCLEGACSEEYHVELYSMFPNLKRFPLLKNCWPSHNSTGVEFAGNCWNYDNVSRLHKYDNDTFINLYTSYLQSYKFFHKIRSEILYMFDFSDSVKGLVDDYARQMFDQDNSTKICAHIRQGDFNGPHPLLPSTESFTVNSLIYLLLNPVLAKSNKSLSVLLFSDDIEFSNNLARQIKNLKMVSKAFVSRELNRLENIALGVRHCDYMLLTSSGSTFGWWMAYLMSDKKQEKIYYNSLFFKKGNEETAKDWHEEDFFPFKWKRLVYDSNHNVTFEQNRTIPIVAI